MKIKQFTKFISQESLGYVEKIFKDKVSDERCQELVQFSENLLEQYQKDGLKVWVDFINTIKKEEAQVLENYIEKLGIYTN
ncbi:hypothetical protein [Capnocytophaga granulosa]|jgi:hypothetical protein